MHSLHFPLLHCSCIALERTSNSILCLNFSLSTWDPTFWYSHRTFLFRILMARDFTLLSNYLAFVLGILQEDWGSYVRAIYYSSKRYQEDNNNFGTSLLKFYSSKVLDECVIEYTKGDKFTSQGTSRIVSKSVCPCFLWQYYFRLTGQ